VFPRDAQHPFVTVRDVLAAVHDANCVFTIEFYYLPPTYNLWGSPTERVQTLQSQAAISDVNVGQLITEFLPGSSVWAGISPSPPEPDVWIEAMAMSYCPISFNSHKGVTCDHLYKILVSYTSQKEGDRVQPAAELDP
jgi:hypothetical protein